VAVVIVALSPLALFAFSDRYIDVCYSGAIFRSLLGFFLGFLCYRVWLIAPCVLFPSAFECIASAASLIIVSIAGAGPLSFACPLIFALSIYFLAHENGLASRLLRLSPLVAIGELSYSIYMTHLFVQARILNIIGALVPYTVHPSPNRKGV
jgi:peptidoglycan/LPS O-acetylase OafA/YrhL